MNESKDKEISAIETVLKALMDFGLIERERILKYVISWTNDPKTLPATEPAAPKGEQG